MHRDLKPANLMLGGIPHETGTREMAAKEGVIKIADFGLSRSLAIMQHKNTIGDSMHDEKKVTHAPHPPLLPILPLGLRVSVLVVQPQALFSHHEESCTPT